MTGVGRWIIYVTQYMEKFALGFVVSVSELSECSNCTFRFHICQVSVNRRHQSDALH